MTNAQRAIIHFVKALEKASLLTEPTAGRMTPGVENEWIMTRADLSEFVRHCAIRALAER